MRTHVEPSIRRSLLAIALLASAGTACQAPGPTPDPTSANSRTSAPSPAAAVTDAGTVVLTDEGCAWDDHPGTINAGPVTIATRNDTEDYGVFPVHRLLPGKSWTDGEAAIALIQEALRDGTDWPEEVFEVSVVIDEGAAVAGGTDTVRFTAAAGTIGVVCSANTSPTGEVLTTFLVGPLIVAGP